MKNRRAFFLIILLMFIHQFCFSREVGSEPTGVIQYYRANELIQDTRLPFKLRSPLAMRAEFKRAGNFYKIEMQSLPRAGIFIDVQTLTIRSSVASVDQIVQSYLSSTCTRQVSPGRWAYDCQASNQNDSNRVHRFVYVQQKDTLLHVIYIAYHNDFFSSARRIIERLEPLAAQ